MSTDEYRLNEAFNTLKQAERDYFSNPANVELAIEYSYSLHCAMRDTYNRMGGRYDLSAYQAMLKSLTDVYRKYPYNEKIASYYMWGISYIPEHIGGNVIEQMFEIVRQFPNNKEIEFYCGEGLYLLAVRYDNRGDLVNAERVVKYFKILYDRYPSHNYFITTYARTLWHIYRNKGFFVKRGAVSELKKIAEQHPNEETIRFYRTTK